MQTNQVYNIIVTPHVSEKSTLIGEKHNQYVFKVAKTSNKQQVKKAVETIFKVDVQNVNILLNKGKSKKFRNKPGKRSDTKKAIVRIVKGQQINFTGE